MTPDFTLIWPLSCLKDRVHLSVPTKSSPPSALGALKGLATALEA